jgi:hypothetical protein
MVVVCLNLTPTFFLKYKSKEKAYKILNINKNMLLDDDENDEDEEDDEGKIK